MAVNKVEIQNLTVFEDISVDFCNGINVLIGENGTGKTHLMKSLYMVISQGNTPTPQLSKFFGDFPILKRNEKENTFIEINEIYKMSLQPHDEFFGSFVEAIDYHYKEDIAKEFLSFAFIPAKDMLTHSKGFPALVRQKSGMPFDDTLMEIIDKALVPVNKEIPEIAKSIIPILEKHIGGKIIVENDDFYVERTDGKKVKFSVEAEGIKKIGLLWRLLMNESITKDTILFWDEPEANINPKLIPDVVKILLELSRQGVQIFAATHDYSFAEYIGIIANSDDNVLFVSLFKDENGSVKTSSSAKYGDLHNNPLETAEEELYNAVIEKSMEG